MKDKLLSFFKSHGICFLAGTLIVLIYVILAVFFKDVVVSDSDLFVITVSEKYMFLGWPLLSALFGILFFVFSKKVFIPCLVFSLTAFVGLFAIDTILWPPVFTVVSLIWFGYAFVFSFFFALLAKFINWLIRECKKAWTE